jgi:hypothetical protein
MARTTIRLDDELLAAAKREAAASGRTLGEVLEDAIRQSLAVRDERRRSGPVKLPTFKGDGLLPGVDLDDSAALADLMDPAS